jgi:hypothetical protein
VVFPVAALMGGIQASLIISLQIVKLHHVEWPVTLMAALSAALLALGVLRHYWDIWIHRTVRGISFIFVGIDAAGDLFSLISVFFQPNLDVAGMAIYGTELLLWLGVFACGGYFNLLPWIQRGLKNHKRITTRHDQEDRSNSLPEPLEYATQQHTSAHALHDMPSSTSVFRTPSGSSSSVRERASVIIRENNNTDHVAREV